MIVFKINGNKHEIPTEWQEVKYGQYLSLMEVKDNTDILSIFTGIEVDLLRKAQINGLESILLALDFLKIKPEFGGSVKRCGKYELPIKGKGEFNIRFESLGQFEDMRKIINQLPESIFQELLDKNLSTENAIMLMKAYGKFIAIYLQKIRDGEYDPNLVPSMEDEVLEMPVFHVEPVGAFFFLKAAELIEWHSKNLPPYFPEIEEIEAGFDKLGKSFGSYGTIDRVARTIGVPEEVLYRDWSAQEFWYKHLYLAWESHIQAEYHRLIMRR